MGRVQLTICVTVCSLTLVVLLFLSSKLYSNNGAASFLQTGKGYSGRHLMSTEEEDEYFVEEIPKPELSYAILRSDFPYVDGGDELLYTWQLNHRVEEEHTAVIVSFEVNIPSSTFHLESLNISLSSYAFQLNETRIYPISLEHSASEEKVRFSVDLWDHLWVNLTEPWQRPDCWWTEDKFCYLTDHSDCIFLDLSPNQNWDPFFCRGFDVANCLPSNVTSECFYINTTECLEQVYQGLGNPELARCPELYNTSCIQINDRGLFYGQYDWTRPPPDPPPVGYEKELCGLTGDALWAFQEIIDSVTYLVEIIISVDEEAGCSVVQMTPEDKPQIHTTTYNPYQGIPTTGEYLLAKQCLNVNTTGFYSPPPTPIEWKDFNITVSFTGVISNYILVNQVFVSNLIANITQVSKRPREQLINVTASLEYEVKLPWVGLSAIPTFSNYGQSLKHEKIDHHLRIQLPHAISYGMKVVVTFQEISNEVKMTFQNDTPSWSVSGNMVTLTSGFMVNETHDEHGLVTMHTMMEYKSRALRPSIRTAFYKNEDVAEGLVNFFEVEIPPVFCIDDDVKDTFSVVFSSRVLTTVATGDQLRLPMQIEVVNAPRGRFSGGGAPRLTVVDQPFIPLVSPAYPSLHPDTGDDFVFSFNLTHLLEVPIFDIWMNVSCPDLHTVSGTLILGFVEPINVTTDSEYDLAVVMRSSLHFHLVQLTPDVNFCGNQTFHMWDNQMLTHQPTSCSIYLSYRKEGKDLVLPYEAAEIEMFTLPGITFELYEKDLLMNMSMYEMAIGSNATFVVNITFPETSTQLGVTLTMPSPVLAVYSSLVVHQGSNLALTNATEYEVYPNDADIDTWPIGSRTVVNLHFGTVTNDADNVESYQGDSLVFEFNCVLRDTETVVKDTEHTLDVTVSYSGSEDLEQETSVVVLEPDVHLDFRLTNDSMEGDPGDVFQYHLILNHTQRTQTPAHHVLIQFHLPYMGIYQDFVPGNGSQVPRTSIREELGVIQADSVLQLYLYKLDMDQIITGTFLIKISTKLTEGIALLATANYTVESFYQWGRSYPYNTVSENVINIRNATLYFLGTSQPQTRKENVTIHEQVSYKLYIPLPPIATNLTLLLDLPQREVTMKKWEVEKLRSQTPKRPPIEQTFYDQGCYRVFTSQECRCHGENQNDTLTVNIDSDEESCRDVTMENCTTIINETASLIGRNNTVDDCVFANVSLTENCTDVGNCSSTNASDPVDGNSSCNVSRNDTAVDHEEVCDFSSSQRERCESTVLRSCENNSAAAQKWPFAAQNLTRRCQNISYFEDTTADGDNMTTISSLNTTSRGVSNYTGPTGHYGMNFTSVAVDSTTPDLSEFSTNPTPDLPEFSTNPTVNISSETLTNASFDRPWEVCDEFLEVDCRQFSSDFCHSFEMRNCSEDLFREDNSTIEQPVHFTRTCFCKDLPTQQPESLWTRSPYYICDNTTEAELLWSGDESLNEAAGLNFDICEEEETVMLAVAEVVSTEITSTREGAACHFVGGNRHDPLDAGVTYYAAYLPANDTDIGDSVSAIVTMVILDDPSLSRGDLLELNSTSIFSYVTALHPPSSIFRENCTCSRSLRDFYDPDSSINCSCDTMNLHNMNQSECNFTSSYQDEDTDYPLELSCGCINYCRGNVSYFENPLMTFDVRLFHPNSCDCELVVNDTLLQREPSLLDHMESCGRSHLRNYSCDVVNVTVTHRTVDIEDNCTCVLDIPSLAQCTCNYSAILDEIEAKFVGEIYHFQNCRNGQQQGEEEDEYRFNLTQADCFCLQPGKPNSTLPTTVTTPIIIKPTTTSLSNFSHENLTLINAQRDESIAHSCSCKISCIVDVEEESLAYRRSQPFYHHLISYTDNFCECERRYTVDRNISEFIEWMQATVVDHAVAVNVTVRNASSTNLTSTSTMSANVTESDYLLDCYCFNISRTLKNIPDTVCAELQSVEYFESECFVPPDNQTQFTIDHWNYNATDIDQMATSISHEVVVVEPELQVTFTRHPLPEIVDRIDQVAFDFEVSHTASSDSPAFNVYLQLDAINFTRNSASGELLPSSIYSDQHCISGNLCKAKYWNGKGLFHLPFLPVEPPGVVFLGTFNLSVGNRIDFVADSLLTGRSIVVYDSCIVDFVGRSYGPINASDTVQVDAPTVSAGLDFCTAYAHLFYASSTDEIPQVFSVGDYVRVKASLWVPEVTLHLTNLTISSDMTNVTIINGEVFLTDRIWNRNDTDSIYQEISYSDTEGFLYYGLLYSQAKFQDGGVTIVPGIIINEADNIADEDDNLEMTLTFRANDVSSWFQGEEINFVISASYLSDYPGELVTLQDDTVTLTMVEPYLNLRVEILDHQFLANQITSDAAYTCQANDCCESTSCDIGKSCRTDVDDIEACSSVECLCYAGFVSHEGDGCSAMGRTSGDIVTFGLTATHHPDFTGNAFDVIIVVHSDLPSSLLPNSHFISHPFAPDYISTLSMPSLTQPSDRSFKLYIQRFNHLQMCERFAVPFRIDPSILLRAGDSWSANASLTYYSAKPYGIKTESNTNSRFYEFDGDNNFVFHAPTPSAEFYMMPTSGTSSKIDFRIYSSSNQNHTVTANLAQENSVRFQLKFVIPKILTDLTIVLALPEGSGFLFHHGSLIFQGSRVSISEAEIKETTNLDGRSYVYISSPGIYSSPNVIEKQRVSLNDQWIQAGVSEGESVSLTIWDMSRWSIEERFKPFNGTIQRRFKSMLGDTQPYPSEPSCTETNSTLYEKPLMFGCYNDSEHYFPITMATENHPINYNFSGAMTNQLCYHLCRAEGFFVSGTKNGTDCFCGDFTTYQQYEDNAGTFHVYVNVTVDEPYIETVWVACNKTGVTWTNQTVTATCFDDEAYQECMTEKSQGCQNKMYSLCSENFMNGINCTQIAVENCNGSSDTACITEEWQKCQDVMFATCNDYGKLSCDLQSANGSIHASCLGKAQEVYRVNSISICQNRSHVECLRNKYENCTGYRNESCNTMATANCTDWSTAGFGSDQDCIEHRFTSCLGKTEEACSVLSEDRCYNQSDTCTLKKPTNTDVYVEDCRDVLWDNCTTCMYDIFWDCHHVNGEAKDGCSEDAVKSCLHLCYQQNCSSIFHPIYEEYIFPTCSWEEVQPTEFIYPSNCSVDITRWREVTVLVLEEKVIPLSMCGVLCSGDGTQTCGSEDFILMSGVLEMSLVEQTCDWFVGLYDPDEDIITWEFELQVSPLDTKGITELIHPLVSYTHGPERRPTLIPFAPFRLEAGKVNLLMTVWVAAELSGYRPGDLIEYYTEVRHHPNSTVTARDITVWWIVPAHVQFINLTNHAHAHYEYNEMQPVTVKSTDSTQGITFYVPTLRNMDMFSFHFLVRLDPEGTLPAGDYNLVAFAEMDYYSWDLYNPHEGHYKHHIVPYYHDPEITRVQFKVQTPPIMRPERDDIKLKMYSFLYDEGNDIFYACFYNRTGNRRDGGCFMTGSLIDPLPDTYPSCDDYCNCTFQEGLIQEDNCTDVMPRPANCSCGCHYECQEELPYCQDSCFTCRVCNSTLCSADCELLYQNCTTTCCERDCSQESNACMADCSLCDQLLGCSVQECRAACQNNHELCNRGCHPVFTSCGSNCTSAGVLCSSHCVDQVCQNVTSSNDEFHLGASKGVCLSECRENCDAVEGNCTKGCCTEQCDSEGDVCLAGCMRTCQSDVPCMEYCSHLCNTSRADCSFDCDLASASCSGRCDLYELSCREECPVECHEEICRQDTLVTCTELMDVTTDQSYLTPNTTESILDHAGSEMLPTNSTVPFITVKSSSMFSTTGSSQTVQNYTTDHLNTTESILDHAGSEMLPTNSTLPYIMVESSSTTGSSQTVQNYTTDHVTIVSQSDVQTATVETVVMDTTGSPNNTEQSTSEESITGLYNTTIFRIASQNFTLQDVSLLNTSTLNASINDSENGSEIYRFVNATSNCTVVRREICGEDHTVACGDTCKSDCWKTGNVCRRDCCRDSCVTQLQDCQAVCLVNCTGDDECYKFCRFACEDDYETCSNPCKLMEYRCNSDCRSSEQICVGQCITCQSVWNSTQMATSTMATGTMATSTMATSTMATSTSLQLTTNASAVIDGVNSTCSCNQSAAASSNYTFEFNNSTEDYNCSCGNSSRIVRPQTVGDVCGKSNMSQCMLACNSSVARCYEACPCEEGCHIDAASCRLTCRGCQLPCYDQCYGNCTIAVTECQGNCEQSLMRMETLYECIDLCNSSCLADCFTNQTENVTCVTDCSRHRAQCISQCTTQYLAVCINNKTNFNYHWNNSTSTGADVLSTARTDMTGYDIGRNVTYIYNSTVSTLLENSTSISDILDSSPDVSVLVTGDVTTPTDGMITSLSNVTTVMYEGSSEASDSTSHVCSVICLNTLDICLNGTEVNATFKNVLTCSDQYDICIAQCIGDHTQTCCRAACSSDNATCILSCSRCGGCLGDCKDSCDSFQDSCVSGCQRLEKHRGNRSVDCDGYASCALGCKSETDQNCTLACLQLHIDRNCSSVPNCSAFDDVCLSHRRRKRGSGEAQIIFSGTPDTLSKTVVFHRGKRSAQQNDTLAVNVSSPHGHNQSHDLCNVYQQYRRNLTEFKVACQNSSFTCSSENSTHCCEVNGTCVNRDNSSVCGDALYDDAPIRLKDCIADCRLTSTYCDDHCQNCSDSDQCFGICSEVCHFAEPIDRSAECAEHCVSSLVSTSCSQDCNSSCPNGAGSLSCDICNNRTFISTNQNCSDLVLTNSSSHDECLALVVYPNCTCNCSCEETERKAFKWRRMHLSVGNVLGYNSVNGTLYGLSRNGLAILESTDVGDSWRAISDREWSDIRSSRWFTPAERLDEGSLLTLNGTSPQFTFVSDAWNSSYRLSGVGLHHQASSNWTELWETLGIWTCCDM